MNIKLKSPIYSQLELTMNCNNFCNYCYNYWRKNKDNPQENHDLIHFKKIIDELIKNEVFQLTITGGEPLLRRDILFEIINYASGGDIDVSLNTNLTLIDRGIAKELKKRGLKSILGSLISYDKETHNRISNSNNYDKTIRGIEIIVSEEISLGINMVVEKENLEQVYKTAELCSRLGVNHFFATKLNPCPYKLEQTDLSLNLEETKRSLDSLLEAKNNLNMKVDVLEPLPHCAFIEQKYLDLLDRTCTAGITWIAIGPEGNVRPCTHIDENCGNILEEGLQKIWSKMNKWNNEEFIPEECKKECLEYVFCGGGCRASALCNGNIKGKDILMTNPIKISLSHNFGDEVEVDDNQLFYLNRNIRYRDEEFGITVYVNPKKIAFLNSDSKEILARMNHLKNFRLKDIVPYIKNNHKSFIMYLLQKGILHKNENI